MWVLVVMSFLYGDIRGQTVNFIRLNSETTCNQVATQILAGGEEFKKALRHQGFVSYAIPEKLSTAFCIYDDMSDSGLKGLKGIEKGLDNSFGKTKKK